jgi:ParB-like chromosome segregation protein Spo0J
MSAALGEAVLLSDITVSHNPRATRRGVLERFHAEGAHCHSATSREAFVSYMTTEQPDIENLRLSIEQHGLLQPPTVRAFRAKNPNGEGYVQRYGIVLGEGRILALALIEARTGVAQTVNVKIEPRLGVDAAFEQGLAENLDRNDMNPVDLATAFHEMLTIRERLATLAEVMGLDLEAALTERDLRLARLADAAARTKAK